MTQQVKLLTQHTHAGRVYQPGEIVPMEDADAAWYREAVVGQRQAASETPAAKAIADEKPAEGKKKS